MRSQESKQALTLTTNSRQQMLDILKANTGFYNPEEWIGFALQHSFQPVKATRLKVCPDCSAQHGKCIGQYIYYSTLIGLRRCSRCGLIYSDTHIDPKIVSAHFESAYKDDRYFSVQRARIFHQIAELVSSCTPQAGSVLDFGGAKGHLLAALRELRPDIDLTLNDISNDACDYGRNYFDLKTICGGVAVLENIKQCYDTVIMSDVIYYEPDLAKLWSILPSLVHDRGAVIIRNPNKLPLILLSQFFIRSFSYRELRESQSRIRHFNPEHLYIFTWRYFSRRLKALGFKVVTMPSELLLKNQNSFLPLVFYCFSKILWRLSGQKCVISPSFIVLATREKNRE